MPNTDTIKLTKQLKEKINLYHHITTSENTDINYDVIYLDTTSQTFINLNVKDKLNFTIKPLKEILKLTNNNPNPKIFLNTLWQYTHPEDKKQLITYSKKTLNHQKTPLFIFRIINPNSNEITYIKRIVTFIDNIAIVKLIDVTTTKNTEILQENHVHEFSNYKNQLESIHQAINGFIYTFKLTPTGRPSFPYISEGCYSIYGIEAKKIIKNANYILELIHPEDSEQFNTSIQDSAETLAPWSWTGRIITNNITKTLSAHSIPQKETDGSILWAGICMDVSEKVALSNELKKQNNLFNNLENLTQSYSWEIDLKTNKVWWSNNGYRLLKTPPSTKITIDYFMNLLSPKYKNIVNKKITSLLKTKKQQDLELEFKHLPQQLFYEEKYLKYDENGTPIKIYGQTKNITKQHQLQQDKENSITEYKNLIDTANAPIFGIDTNGNINEWNQKTSKITGFTKKDVLGKNLINELILESEKNAVNQIIKNALNGKETDNYTLPLLTKDNHKIILLINATTRRDSNGNIIGVIGVGQDITELKKQEQKTTQIGKELTTLIDTANAPIFGIDTNGNINEWNQKTSKITGFTKKDVLGKNLVNELISETEKNAVNQIINNALKGKETDNYTLPLLTKNNQNIVLLINATTRRDSKGKIIGVIGVGQDITEKETQKEELLLFKQFKTILHDFMSDYNSKHALSQIITYVNMILPGSNSYILKKSNNTLSLVYAGPQISQSFQKKLHTIPIKNGDGPCNTCAYLNKPIIITNPINHPYCNNIFQIIKENNINSFWSYPVNSNTNELLGVLSIYFNKEKTPSSEEQQKILLVSQLLGTIMQFNQMKEKEESLKQKLINAPELLQSQKIEVIGRLAGGIAHDFNNSLAIINPLIELLKIDTTNPETLENYSIILDATKQAQNVVKQLLQFARQEKSQKEIIDIKNLISSTIPILEKTLGKHIQLITNIEKIKKVIIFGDPTQLKQVLLNIAINAADAMPNGGIFKISSKKNNKNIDLQLSDTGTGIESSILDTIFEPFFTTKPQGQGTGLGLSVIKGIIDNHQGLITANNIKTGACFTITLPILQKIIQKPNQYIHNSNISKTYKLNQLSILLIDDEKNIRHSTKKLLEKMNYTVTTAKSATEGIELYKKKNHDIIMLDYQMPNINGIKAYYLFKKINPNSQFIIYTGDLYSDPIQKFTKKEKVPLIYKPFCKNQLTEIIKTLKSNS